MDHKHTQQQSDVGDVDMLNLMRADEMKTSSHRAEQKVRNGRRVIGDALEVDGVYDSAIQPSNNPMVLPGFVPRNMNHTGAIGKTSAPLDVNHPLRPREITRTYEINGIEYTETQLEDDAMVEGMRREFEQSARVSNGVDDERDPNDRKESEYNIEEVIDRMRDESRANKRQKRNEDGPQQQVAVRRMRNDERMGFRSLGTLLKEHDKTFTGDRRRVGDEQVPGSGPAKTFLDKQTDALLDAYTKYETDRNAKERVRTHAEIVSAPSVSRISEGEKRYQRVKRMVIALAKASGFILEPTQEEFINEFIASCAPIIYGDDWHSERHNWKKKHKRTKIHQQVFCLTPRRFGKTTSVTLFVTAMILVIPDIRIVVLSQNGRTSRALLELCGNLIGRYNDNNDVDYKGTSYAKRKIATQTSDSLSVISDEDMKLNLSADAKRRRPMRSTIVACPSTANGMYQNACLCFCV